MDFPKIDPKLVQITIGGIPLTFRSAVFADIELLFENKEKNIPGLEANLRLLATLLHYPEKTFEDKLSFLKSLPIQVYSAIDDTNAILDQLGFEYKKDGPVGSEEDKKKSDEISLT